MNTIEYPTVRWARELPDHPAVIIGQKSISYGMLERLIVSAACGLRDRGVKPGDRIVICGANSLEWVVAAHALARLGAVAVPIGTWMTRREAELRRAKYEPWGVLVDSESTHLWGAVIALPELISDAAPDRDLDLTEIDPDRLHSIVETSGSEGEPKGVCLTFRNHLSSALGSALNLGIRTNDRWLLNLPLDRIGGLAIVLRAAIYGTTVVIHTRFDAEAVWNAIDTVGVTQLSLVATTLRRMLDCRPLRDCPPQVRTVMVGGGPVPATLIDEARARGFPILPTYGLTETSSQIATLSPAAPESKRHSAGHPLPLAEIEIRDETGKALPPRAEGRICVRGPMVSHAYWAGSDRSETILDTHGWFCTRDIGSFDEDGYLMVHGRMDNVIISGGMKLHAEEIESVLTQHPAVRDALVVGVEDREWGQTPVAYTTLNPDCGTEAPELLAFVRNRLPHHKCPRRIEIVDALPVLPSGKPDRRAVCDR